MILSNTDRIDPHIDLLQAAGLPFVTLGRSQASREFAWVDLDFEHVAETSIDRLVAGGHRRIAVTVPFGELNHGYVFLEAYRGCPRRSTASRSIPTSYFALGWGWRTAT